MAFFVMGDNRFKEILKQYWGHDSFRPLQEEIILSVTSGKDTLALMPTGGGKSITFQVPALAMDGICIVISPLIALMKDQVDRLKRNGIKAVVLHSGMTTEEIDIALDNCIYGDYKFLYVSPERISSRLFQIRVQMMNVCLIAVDEAHCISQWGYDFRPSYLKIAELRDILPENVPILALTASATPTVVDDIMSKLRFKEQNVLKTSFERKNISYIVRHVEDKLTYLVNTLSQFQGVGIIYTRSRKKCKEVAELLQSKNISADYYHAGLSQEIRDRKQDDWTKDRVRIMVCTNAFGMGIDKPDVRFVIHMEMPSSIEEYFQESGRAGRDGKRSYAVLLYTSTDRKKLENTITKKFPPISQIKDVYESLCNYLRLPLGDGLNQVFDFNFSDFLSKSRLPVIETTNSLSILQQEQYVEFTEEIYNTSRVMFIVNRDALYNFQMGNVQIDFLIKIMLRSYTGMFSEYTPINEADLAQKTGMSRDQIYDTLVNLSKRRIINYIPGKKTAMVVFCTERLDKEHLYISNENYKTVKDRYIERVNKMIDYAEIDTRCRSVMLLDYFGEVAKNCGTCDVCKSSIDISKDVLDEITNSLQTILSDKQISLHDLVPMIPFPSEDVIKVIRWLLDYNKITMDSQHNLSWKKTVE